jgi:LacI family transcriptional regulator
VIAIGLLSRLHAAGFSVPEQFRVIGFDGVGVSSLAHPTLTTIRQPVETMSRAIRTLIETAVSGSDGPPTSRRLRPSLVIGESSPERV